MAVQSVICESLDTLSRRMYLKQLTLAASFTILHASSRTLKDISVSEDSVALRRHRIYFASLLTSNRSSFQISSMIVRSVE
jgi:hypothetical protein